MENITAQKASRKPLNKHLVLPHSLIAMWILEATTRSTRFTSVWTLLAPTSSNARCYHTAALVVIKLNSPPSPQTPTTTNSDRSSHDFLNHFPKSNLCMQINVYRSGYMCPEPSDARRFFLQDPHVSYGFRYISVRISTHKSTHMDVLFFK